MSLPGVQWPLEEDETLLWQGRPAPRCYTFRNWKLAAAGTALFLACSFWLMLGYQLVQAGDHSSLLASDCAASRFSFRAFISSGSLRSWRSLSSAATLPSM